MVQCDQCGRDVDLPFRCNYCGGYYCSNHRLPEFHDCTGLYREKQRFGVDRDQPSYSFSQPSYGPRYRRTIQRLFSFSKKELKHLGISLLIILAMPFMWFQEYLFRSPIIVFVALLIFAAAFLLHEVAHKFMAQRLGYWAEFRLNELGLMITLLSFISPIKVIAPGAVVIAGLMYGDDYGKISLSGPVANIIQAVFFLLLSFIFRNSLATFLTLVGVAINSSLALFNLIPFGVFDGVKILRWSWKAWLVVTTISAILFIYAYF